ncbi:hypothetical protein [Deferribacter desulfuricans]|uniref:hypothetical protein n=1 Tax=Deferribacter desulfuricans TaxID=197162 RepID=UPI0003054FAA|nr:hypothetical protein [Deferribacter desulfuricans]
MTYENALKQVKNSQVFEDKTILKLANDKGWTIAHVQATWSWIINDKEILKLANKRGRTVAHVILYTTGYMFKYKKLLQILKIML